VVKLRKFSRSLSINAFKLSKEQMLGVAILICL